MRNTKSAFSVIGAKGHANESRAENDYYATDPAAVSALLEKELFSKRIWEPACGEGHISEALINAGYVVRSTDLFYRGYGEPEPVDFLQYSHKWGGDIITNPPYEYGIEFAEKALKTVKTGSRVAMLLKIQFLETEKRRLFFKKYPPRYIYVFSKRIMCAKNGDFQNASASAMCYAWFVWEKGFAGEPKVRWL